MQRMNLVSWIVVFLLALCAAMTGVFLADEWTGSHRAQTTTDFHELMHDNLNLTSDQEAALKQIEDRFGRRKAEIEAKVRKTNRALAEAIETEKTNSPRVQSAVDDCNAAFGEMQAATVEHILEMREILTDQQALIFDAEVVRALTEP
jgi:Spy/CpxP family protein refolding chaperone